jgi:Uma2 family endonuclease
MYVMAISEAEYERIALEDPDNQWELIDGRLQSKACTLTTGHDFAMDELGYQLLTQLDRRIWIVRVNLGRLRVSTGSFYIPDVCVIPRDFVRRKLREARERLEVYDEPLPFVAEVWSPSTGAYDLETKLREYQLRRDAEIWRVHPIERGVTAWRLQADGSYSETELRGGRVALAALPDVTVDLDALFADGEA